MRIPSQCQRVGPGSPGRVAQTSWPWVAIGQCPACSDPSYRSTTAVRRSNHDHDRTWERHGPVTDDLEPGGEALLRLCTDSTVGPRKTGVIRPPPPAGCDSGQAPAGHPRPPHPSRDRATVAPAPCHGVPAGYAGTRELEPHGNRRHGDRDLHTVTGSELLMPGLCAPRARQGRPGAATGPDQLGSTARGSSLCHGPAVLDCRTTGNSDSVP